MLITKSITINGKNAIIGKKCSMQSHIINYKLTNDKYNINLDVSYNLYYMGNQMIFYSYIGKLYNKNNQFIDNFEIKSLNIGYVNEILVEKNKAQFTLYFHNYKLNKLYEQNIKELEKEILDWILTDNIKKLYTLAHQDYIREFGL